jgi:hypothetical protein
MEKSVIDEMKPKIIKRLQLILQHEGIKCESDEIIKKIVDLHYPDVRFMIKIMDQFRKTYDDINENIFTVDSLDDEFYKFILEGKIKSIREYIVQRNLNYDEMYNNLYYNLVPMLDIKARGDAIVLINEGQKFNNQVANQELNFMATIYKIFSTCA